MMPRLPATLIAAVTAASAIDGAHVEERDNGMRDASVAIGHGRFVVADDELDVLRV